MKVDMLNIKNDSGKGSKRSSMRLIMAAVHATSFARALPSTVVRNFRIPKTAGTSFRVELEKAFNGSQFIFTSYEGCRGNSFDSEREISVTLLREPRAHVYSQYIHVSISLFIALLSSPP